MTGLIFCISADTALLGEVWEACTGRGSLAPAIVGNREKQDLGLDREARTQRVKDLALTQTVTSQRLKESAGLKGPELDVQGGENGQTPCLPEGTDL